jgi:hypothetical protein
MDEGVMQAGVFSLREPALAADFIAGVDQAIQAGMSRGRAIGDPPQVLGP